MSLWTAEEAAAATGGRNTTGWQASGVSIDTRTLQPGDLFVALKAARDGHDFVAQALEKGAAAAVVTHVPEGVSEAAPLLIVEAIMPALEALGRAGRDRTEAQVVAVTGSVGKTSTKEMLRQTLAAFGPTHASVASYNNHWGVPLTLARMPRDSAFAVIEIGMNHPGEIAPLAGIARPHVAMITTVAPAHLEAFGAIEGIAEEKASILAGLVAGGTAVFNAEIETAAILRAAARAAGARYIGFGETPRAQYRLAHVEMAHGVTVARARVRHEDLHFKIAATGRHFAMNGLGVLAVGDALGLDPALAAAALSRWAPVTGRGARQTIALDPVDPSRALEVIDDSYNANPASMEAALAVLAATPAGERGRRIACLGDMAELGDTAPELHAALAGLPAMDEIDRVFCVGPLSKNLWQALPAEKRGKWQPTVADILSDVRRDLRAGDVLLVKGSKATGLSALVDAIRKMGHGAPQ
ncbi:MAG: UDP-N-acetylmuramoyl-tripeptide--D-alanyl-D-alanine ligase [Marinovum algicola]|uniref:UDP-N-acetylmuramoyl-tripeptide--D-alanyl-D-alanine ligase n=1 Tax=Marinovum algicola TaxID=42444 RepID=A0A975W7X9_9RHOB|nr:UDP-N-acetylmuramoyl-tripeptide--D-alanyl-D-alanine ligase [Marinovum algicola]SEI94294.1 UDP-N-acetylmuramoyl-tripeptide--D-alanyl-D-alanine ligase [Marinovum algicola]SLN11051.1 UDP-N-acetylmuramoyl-tripeptide--D-alanyl-D-alanine ligase [Marinovum algicola]